MLSDSSSGNNTMKKSALAPVLWLLLCLCSRGISQNMPARPSSIHIGAHFAFNSTIGRVARIAIAASLEDVNNDRTVLPNTKLVIDMQDTNCSGFVGIAEAMQFMERGNIVALIGPQASSIAHVISNLATELHVPLVSFSATDPTLSSLDRPYFARTTRSDSFQMAAVAQIVDYYQWSKVVALYIDDEYGRNGLYALSNALNERKLMISFKAPMRAGATESDITSILVQVALIESRVIVVNANPTLGAIVFSVAMSLGMMTTGYVWITTDWLISFLDSSLYLDDKLTSNYQGVIALRQHTAHSEKKRALASRWSKLLKAELEDGFRINSYALYAYDTVWTMAYALESFFLKGGNISFSKDPNLQGINSPLHMDKMRVFDSGSLLMESIHQVDFNGVTGPVKFDVHGDLIHPAYDILNVVGTGIRTIGYWSNHSGLSVVPPEELYQQPANQSSANQQLYSVIWPGGTTTKPRGWVFPISGKALRIGVPRRVSYQEFVTEMPGTGTVEGYCIDVFVAAVNLLSYPVPYAFIPYGNGVENPGYDELIHKVATNEFDGAVGDITITNNRTRYVDFTQPYAESGLVVLVALEKQGSKTWAFLAPFTPAMWFVTGLLFIVIGVVIWILEHRHNDEFRGPPKRQLTTTVWFSFSTLFFAHRENTVSTFGRMVLLIWLFVVLIVQSSYTASLTSILTVQQLSSPIKGIDSLRSTDDPIGYQVGSFSANYLVEELGIARSRLKALGTAKEYARALTLGPNKGGVAAVVDEQPYIELFLSTHCKFDTVGSPFTKSGWGFAFPRDSELAVDLSTAILTLSENGELQRIHDKWLTSTTCSSQGSELDSNRLQLDSFVGLFAVFGVVSLLALVLHFIRMLQKFTRHHTSNELASTSTNTTSRLVWKCQAFLAFLHEKEEDLLFKSKQAVLQHGNNHITESH